jgi:catechol 2,3-dioxygenase-like lactoylglutathione lyase family enzyme
MGEFDQSVKLSVCETRLRPAVERRNICPFLSLPIAPPAGSGALLCCSGQENIVRIATLTLLVSDYDQAIGFYRDQLGFELVADTDLGDGKRWVLVAPPGGGARLLLAEADTPQQHARIGDQTGGRVGLFLETDDFARDFERFTANGVRFLEAPRHEPYGSVAVFEDLYGNKWDLIQPR